LVCGVALDVACFVATKYNVQAAVDWIKGVQNVTLWGVAAAKRDREGERVRLYRRFPAHLYACVRVSMMKRWEALEPFFQHLPLPEGWKVRLCKAWVSLDVQLECCGSLSSAGLQFVLDPMRSDPMS
jgi:hypothetical protein